MFLLVYKDMRMGEEMIEDEKGNKFLKNRK